MTTSTNSIDKNQLILMKWIWWLWTLMITIAEIYLVFTNMNNFNVIIPVWIIMLIETYIYMTRRALINNLLSNIK